MGGQSVHRPYCGIEHQGERALCARRKARRLALTRLAARRLAWFAARRTFLALK